MPRDLGAYARQVQVYSVPGVLVTGERPVPWVPTFPLNIIRVRTAVGTAPTGAAILVDVTKNGTTMFTTQGNRPSIAISGTVSSAAVPDVIAVAAGDKITVGVDQIGSTIAGSNLSVSVEFVQTGP